MRCRNGGKAGRCSAPEPNSAQPLRGARRLWRVVLAVVVLHGSSLHSTVCVYSFAGKPERDSLVCETLIVNSPCYSDGNHSAAASSGPRRSSAGAGRGEPLLYLDYDGVLHPEDVRRHPRKGIRLGAGGAGHALFEHCNALVESLAPFPTVGIVLSTSWVRVLGFDKARRKLPPALRDRVVGATFHSAMDRDLFMQMPRGVQILGDVGRRRPSAWLALDDDEEGWPTEWRHALIATHPVRGLGAPGVEQELAQQLQLLATPRLHASDESSRLVESRSAPDKP